MRTKRALALLLSLLMTALLMAPFAVSAQVETPRPTLQFNPNGTFKILYAADLQHWGDEISDAAKKFLHALIQNNHRPEAGEPLGLIVLGGDNLEKPGFPHAYTNYETMIRSYMDIFAFYDIPVAVVFGNHDREAGFELFGVESKSEQVKLYNSYPNVLLMEKDPAYTAQSAPGIYEEPTVMDASQPRFGGYNLPILSSDGTGRTAYNLWFLDTGRGEGVSEASMKWYEWKSDQLKAANGGVPVQSLVFQHIPVPEIGMVNVAHRNAAGNTATTEAGYKGSSSGPYKENPAGQYARMERQGGVRGMFFGHIHENHFAGYPSGGSIKLVNSSPVRIHDQDVEKFYCVGRIITIDEATKNFITRTNLVGGTGNNNPVVPEIVEPRAGAANITFGNLYDMATSYTQTHTSHDLTFVDIKAPTCDAGGLREVSCAGCAYKETQSVATTLHADGDGNGVCDDCKTWVNGCGCCDQHNHKDTFFGRIACFFCRVWFFLLRYLFFGWIWM